MADTKNPPEMTAADAAKCVSRQVPVLGDDKKPTGKFKSVAISAKEVLSFKDCGDTVVVVTVDGQKFTGDKVGK